MGIADHCRLSPDAHLSDLPLIHTTQAFRFRSIVEEQVLRGQHSNYFGEDRIYFFYGRPAYRPALDFQPRTDLFYLPVCLLVRLSSVGELRAIYPFDTGAYLDHLFDGFIHKDMKLESFLLGTAMDIPPKVVSLFFGGNKQYFLGAVKRGLRFDFGDMETQAVYNLLCSQGATPFDDRHYTMEVHAREELLVSTLDIIAVVVPTFALQDKAIHSTIVDTWGAVPLDYEFYQGLRPNEYHYALLVSRSG